MLGKSELDRSGRKKGVLSTNVSPWKIHHVERDDCILCEMCGEWKRSSVRKGDVLSMTVCQRLGLCQKETPSPS